MLRYRLSEEDRARYGGPEWQTIEPVVTWSCDLDYDALVAIEDQIIEVLGDPDKGLTWAVGQFLIETRRSHLIPMQRIRVWLCLLAAGSDITLADCKPKVLAGDLDRTKPKAEDDDDADPPAPGAESSPDPAPSTPSSETSTGGSTPGSPKPTD